MIGSKPTPSKVDATKRVVVLRMSPATHAMLMAARKATGKPICRVCLEAIAEHLAKIDGVPPPMATT